MQKTMKYTLIDTTSYRLHWCFSAVTWHDQLWYHITATIWISGL